MKKPDAVNHHLIGVAAVVGALLGAAFLLLSLSGVPVLGWALLAAVATIAVVDIVFTAAGRRSPSILERLLQRRS